VALDASADAKPEPIARGVRSFEFDRARGTRALIGWARGDGGLDVGVWDAGKVTAIDRGVLAGSAAFVGSDAARLAYAVMEKGREGVYVADLPR
jgi:hypothetical protein